MTAATLTISGKTMCQKEPEASVSSIERPFKLLVRNEIFLIDSESLSKLSPVFAKMLVGKDFENGRELLREIVDEKSSDIAVFLKCLYDFTLISEENFGILTRLANKYQVNSLMDACEDYIKSRCNLNDLPAEQVLALLLAANEQHLSKEVIVKLVERVASEEKSSLSQLRLGRLLTPQLHGAVITANINLTRAKEIASMNKHLFKMARNKLQYKRAPCDLCKRITDAANCEGCRLTLCQSHWKSNPCTNDYGTRMLEELESNIVELEWE